MHRGNSSQNPIWTHSGNISIKQTKPWASRRNIPKPTNLPFSADPSKARKWAETQEPWYNLMLCQSLASNSVCVSQRLGWELLCHVKALPPAFTGHHQRHPTGDNQQCHAKQMAQSHLLFFWFITSQRCGW